MGRPSSNPAAAQTKKGGSALKRLKTTLKDAGLIGPAALKTRVSKKRSQKVQSAAMGARKELKTTLASMAAKAKDNNPFELKHATPKHDVLNRKVKGVQGRPGVTRKRGEEARKKTIMREMEAKGKATSFVDRRFGENDPEMSVEDKMMERFMKEKARRTDRGSIYNLEEEELTHMGQSLAAEDAFEDAGLRKAPDNDDSDDGQIDRDTVRYTHFGGFEETVRIGSIGHRGFESEGTGREVRCYILRLIPFPIEGPRPKEVEE
ncbi:Nop14-like family-domain-containing protein [Blyttiomyces helicus]|uniref:Nop14-like family-domain-containing protein n=1 Tax=Blyttiomyces helicus TaxID=388810 RepID=A0A4V1IQ63_9FUNG|nr:Nop14-like family-domain-containing protein [Blyttiomyces helicus]|eukprot:RKO85457.1 Nop14-like family-domain-containing protein [Blyttiomyces helicus]